MCVLLLGLNKVKHACVQKCLEHQGMILKVCENALYPRHGLTNMFDKTICLPKLACKKSLAEQNEVLNWDHV